MGFRKGAYATVWETRDGNGNYTQARISISKKDKETGEYRTDFNGWIRLIGSAHEKAGALKERSRIKIGECDVTNKYDKEKEVTYVNYAVFSFEDPNAESSDEVATDSDGFLKVENEGDLDELPFI